MTAIDPPVQTADAAPRRPAQPLRRKHAKGPNSPSVLLRSVVIIMALLAIGEGFTRFVSPNLPPPESAGAGEVTFKRAEMTKLGTMDVVFNGDSAMDAGVDPTMFAAGSKHFGTAYNASLLGARLPVQGDWIGHDVIPLTKPRLLVQEINPELLMTYDADPATVTTLDSIIESQITLADEGLWGWINRTTSDASYLVRYKAILRNPKQVYEATRGKLANETSGVRSLDKAIEAQKAEGFWDAAISSSGQYTGYGAGTVAAKVDPGELKQSIGSDPYAAPLVDFLNQAKATRVQMVIVIPPVPLDVWNASGLDTTRWRKAAKIVADQANANDIPLIDLTESGYPRFLFNDIVHLNTAGSTRFSNDLARQIDGLCDSHRLQCG